MSRYTSPKICGGLCKSLRPYHYGRHRSACARAAAAGLETNGTCSRHTDAAPIGQRSPCLDVERRVERPPDKLQIAADSLAAARRPLHDVGTCELLDHGADQRNHTSKPEVKNTHQSRLPVAGHDIRPHEQPRVGAWWLEAHRVRKVRPRHGLALLSARTYVWDITLMIGFNGRARI